jgi:hypothetical protein
VKLWIGEEYDAKEQSGARFETILLALAIG